MYQPSDLVQESKSNAIFNQQTLHDESHKLARDDDPLPVPWSWKNLDFSSEKFDPFKLAGDVTAILAPLALLGFLAAVYQLNGKDVDQSEFTAWHDAITVLATVFPIIFASIVGRLMYEAARWKLESGSTMGVLEQLLGSRSVGSAITTQVYLRAFNILGLVLLLAWALSPLGSQSILRLMETRLDPRIAITDLSHYDNLHGTGFATLPPPEGKDIETADAFFQYLTALYSATLMTPPSVKDDSMDQWGNVKIPFFDFSGLSKRGNEDWHDTDRNPSLEWYSSLAGIPVISPPYGNTTTSIESTYVEVTCRNITRGPQFSGEYLWWDWPTPFYEFEDPGEIPANGTWQGGPRQSASGTMIPLNMTVWSLALNNFVDYYWMDHTTTPQRRNSSRTINTASKFKNEDGVQINPTDLLLRIQLYDDEGSPADQVDTLCSVKQRYVESLVSCERIAVDAAAANCTVSSQRPSQKRHATELISDLNFPWVFGWISERLPQTGSFGTSVRPDMTLQYLHDPSMSTMSLDGSKDMFQNVEPELLGRRLSQILNTYMLLSDLYLAAPGANTRATKVPNSVTSSVPTTTLVEVYAISLLWVILGIVSCGVLLVAGVFGVVFRHKASGPDVLGYASTVLRDSRYIDLPPSTGRMGGLDITRMLKKQRVRYGFTDLVQQQQPLVGVGRAEETRRVKDEPFVANDGQGQYASVHP